MSVGRYLIVEDGIIDAFLPGKGLSDLAEGPLCAVEAFLRQRSDFIPDPVRERYIITYNPQGYLKRIA